MCVRGTFERVETFYWSSQVQVLFVGRFVVRTSVRITLRVANSFRVGVRVRFRAQVRFFGYGYDFKVRGLWKTEF